MKKKLSTEKMIELEEWLNVNRPDKCDREYFSKFFSDAEVDYLVDAFIMPFQEMKIALIRYDSGYPKVDELVFVKELQEKYCVPASDFYRRVRQIRKIMKCLSQNPLITYYFDSDSVFREDNEWKNLVNEDRKIINIVDRALNYDERKKALALKYDILRQMLEYNGLSFDDVREEAENLKNKQDVKSLKKDKDKR